MSYLVNICLSLKLICDLTNWMVDQIRYQIAWSTISTYKLDFFKKKNPHYIPTSGGQWFLEFEPNLCEFEIFKKQV